MMDYEKVNETLVQVIEEFNQGLKPAQQIRWTPNAQLVGPSGLLDSLGLLDFLTRTEEQLKNKHGLQISLATEEVTAQTRNGMTLESLAELIVMAGQKGSTATH